MSEEMSQDTGQVQDTPQVFDTVQVTESFAEGSVEISEFEQIALAFIDSLNLKPKGFGFEVFRA